MLVSLKGQISYKGADFIVLENNNIGYKISIAEQPLLDLLVGDQALIYIHDHVREDAHELFGFSSMSHLEFFWQIINVSGVGPKLGQKIMTASSLDGLKQSIMKGDVEFLTGISGVGKKTAQKIVLELKGSVSLDDDAGDVEDNDVIDALVSLGYTRQDAREVLRMIPAEIAEAEKRIKEALKLLSR